MLSQAAQMKKVMPAPLKNVPREQPTSTMVTLGRSKLVGIAKYVAQKNNYIKMCSRMCM